MIIFILALALLLAERFIHHAQPQSGAPEEWGNFGLSMHTLAWILISEDGRFFWRGPGMHIIGDSIPMRIPKWESFKAAAKAAEGIKQAMSIILKPQRMSTRT